MPRVNHFDLPADDPERLVEFYRTVFGWHISKWSGPSEYWMAGTGDPAQPGINGGFVRRQEPSQGVVDTIDVDDIDAYLAKVEEAGGAMAAAKMAIPGVGWLAFFRDTEGNLLGLRQIDRGAR